jgi:hypothetical protein
MQRPERADPTAEHPAEQERYNNRDDGKEKCPCRGMGRQQRRDENKRVEIKKETHGISEFIVPLGFGLDEQKEKQEQEQPLDEPASILDSEEAHEYISLPPVMKTLSARTYLQNFLESASLKSKAALRQVPRLAFTFFCSFHRTMHDETIVTISF